MFGKQQEEKIFIKNQSGGLLLNTTNFTPLINEYFISVYATLEYNYLWSMKKYIHSMIFHH